MACSPPDEAQSVPPSNLLPEDGQKRPGPTDQARPSRIKKQPSLHATKAAAAIANGSLLKAARSRALGLVGQHAKDYAKEAQKTKWVVDMVMRVDAEQQAALAEERERTASVQTNLDQLQATVGQDLADAQAQNKALQARVQELEVQLYNTSYAHQAISAQHADMQASLAAAEGAAARANTDCCQLAAAVKAMAEQDARARQALAHRAHLLRTSLLSTGGRLREFNDRDRRNRDEAEWKLRQRETALAAEKQALQDQHAAQQARDAELEALQLNHHLAQQQIKQLQQAAAAAAKAMVAAADMVGSSQEQRSHTPKGVSGRLPKGPSRTVSGVPIKR